MNKLKYLIVALIGIAALGLQQAKAVPFTSSLNAPNDVLSAFDGPYGTVSITLVDATHATVTFTGTTINGNTYMFGGAQGTDLNINGSATASGFSFTQNGVGFDAPIVSGQGSGTVDGHGDYNLTIDYFNGFKHAFDSVEFTLTATGATTWASASNVLALNADGFDAAAHIFVTSAPANQANGAIATGFAGERPGSVPDSGTTAMLLGSALSVLGIGRRYLKS